MALVNQTAKQVVGALPGDRSLNHPFVNGGWQYHLLVAEAIHFLSHDRPDHAIEYNKDVEESIRIIKIRKPVFREEPLQGKYRYPIPCAGDTCFTEWFAETCKRHGRIGRYNPE